MENWYNDEGEITITDLIDLLREANTPQFGRNEDKTLIEFLDSFVCYKDTHLAIRLMAAILTRLQTFQLKETYTKFAFGDKVRKISGSKWSGTVVGRYSTELTPEGYAVESSSETGSVQIYPASALEKVMI